jgi:CheY-like chemotaxis protein
MIEELLKISRLQTGKITVKKTFFDACLSAAYALRNLKHHADKKEVLVINDIPRGSRIFADFDLFGEVVQNLVSNAIKFCSKGDSVTMFLPPGNEKATFAVKDTGTGISGEVLPKLFLHGETTSTQGTAGEKGTGLGLPFSHDIIRAHNGSLRVESKEGEGSVFYAELPIVRPKVLIVDDSKIVRGKIQEQLQDLNLNFDDAENGKEASKYLESNIPHLILLDIEMPVMNGLELLEHIRKNPTIKSIPVIVITGSASPTDRETAFQLGANDFISKPFVLEDAIPRIRRFLG